MRMQFSVKPLSSISSPGGKKPFRIQVYHIIVLQFSALPKTIMSSLWVSLYLFYMKIENNLLASRIWGIMKRYSGTPRAALESTDLGTGSSQVCVCEQLAAFAGSGLLVCPESPVSRPGPDSRHRSLLASWPGQGVDLSQTLNVCNCENQLVTVLYPVRVKTT